MRNEGQSLLASRWFQKHAEQRHIFADNLMMQPPSATTPKCFQQSHPQSAANKISLSPIRAQYRNEGLRPHLALPMGLRSCGRSCYEDGSASGSRACILNPMLLHSVRPRFHYGSARVPSTSWWRSRRSSGERMRGVSRVRTVLPRLRLFLNAILSGHRTCTLTPRRSLMSR